MCLSRSPCSSSPHGRPSQRRRPSPQSRGTDPCAERLHARIFIVKTFGLDDFFLVVAVVSRTLLPRLADPLADSPASCGRSSSSCAFRSCSGSASAST